MDEDEDSPAKAKAASTDTSKLTSPSSLTEAVVSNKGIPSTNSTEDKQTVKAQVEINKLQKEILILQTEKEFLKSSYEIGLAKYWDIEKRITEMQEEVCNLQNEFKADAVIEDNDARALMALTALKSCEDTLVSFQEQQKRSMEQAHMESQIIQSAKDRLKVLTREFGGQPGEENHHTITSEDAIAGFNQARLEIQAAFEKVRKTFEMNSEMSASNLAEKIDELVNKVITLDSTVSSQITQIHRLRLENDRLQRILQKLEEEKGTEEEPKRIQELDKLSHAEEELKKIQELDECVQRERSKLQKDFIESCDTFSDLSDKLQFSERHVNQTGEKEKDCPCSTENSEIHVSIKCTSEDAILSEIQVNGNDPSSMDHQSTNGGSSQELCYSKQNSTEEQECHFPAYLASKLQDEVQSMIQDNNRVADELQKGLNHVSGIQGDVHNSQTTLGEAFEFSTSKSQHHHHHEYQFKNFSSKTSVPLRSFLFGAKPKRQSLFSRIHPTLQKRHSDLSVRRLQP